MKINEKIVEEKLSYINAQLTLIIKELQLIDADTPVNHGYLIELDERYSEAAEFLPDIILFVGREKPRSEILNDKFLKAIMLNNAFLGEKIRILNSTPAIYLETNDLISLN